MGDLFDGRLASRLARDRLATLYVVENGSNENLSTMSTVNASDRVLVGNLGAGELGSHWRGFGCQPLDIPPRG